MSKKMITWIIIVLLVLGTMAYVAIRRWALHHLVIRQRAENRRHLEWTDMGPTPGADKKYSPQGISWVEGKLIFANSWDDERSRVYEINPETMEQLRHFDMPPEAVHTSGLAWDGSYLWAVDHIADTAYKLDLEASFESGKAQVAGSFDTTLEGTSACSMVRFDGQRCLAISDFMHSRKTIFVRPSAAVEQGTAAGQIAFAYENEGFSQGLEYIDGYLYESENKLGTNVLNKIDIAQLQETRCARKATVRQYPAPSYGVEDLAWDGKAIWTSDETAYKFFKTQLGRSEDDGH